MIGKRLISLFLCSVTIFSFGQTKTTSFFHGNSYSLSGNYWSKNTELVASYARSYFDFDRTVFNKSVNENIFGTQLNVFDSTWVYGGAFNFYKGNNYNNPYLKVNLSKEFYIEDAILRLTPSFVYTKKSYKNNPNLVNQEWIGLALGFNLFKSFSIKDKDLDVLAMFDLIWFNDLENESTFSQRYVDESNIKAVVRYWIIDKGALFLNYSINTSYFLQSGIGVNNKINNQFHDVSIGFHWIFAKHAYRMDKSFW